MSYIDLVKKWRNAYGIKRSATRTVAEFGDSWVVMCEGDPFLHLWKNACLMMGWDCKDVHNEKVKFKHGSWQDCSYLD